ncbi:MAG: sigma-70 family RNA polymerase sigma factor [Proteobacteria bacterium]|nr:sigma-70 family RNA polymerase sigma factor [Pseudomonadota bacterium]
MDASDAELLARWRDGDRSAGAALFERYYDAIERFFANKVSVAVGDLVQDTFRACLEGRDRLNDPQKFRSYLFSIAYNVLRVHIRKKHRNGAAVDMEETSMESLLPGPRSVLARREEERLILQALRSIAVQYQVILELYYWEEVRVKEIARILDIPPGTAGRHLQRARQTLEDKLRELAENPALLSSTLANLEDWARSWQRKLGRDNNSEKF